MSELIATETLSLYQRTGHQKLTIDAMRRRYDEIVPACDQWWISEDFYGWLVEYAIHSTDVSQYCGATLEAP